VLNVFSTAGASILAIGFLLPVLYLLWSLYWGEKAADNPWQASGLEWHISSPPPVHNFHEIPVITRGPYHYEHLLPDFEEGQATTTVEQLRREESRRG
jgi:cytochrome c oxidase subunit 1